MNTITNIGVEKGIPLYTNEKTKSSAVAQSEFDTKVSKRDTFEYSDHSQSDNIVYSKPSAATNSTSASGGIYDSANYHSTSISLIQMAAQRSKIECRSDGTPIYKNAVEASIVGLSLGYLSSFTPIETYNHYSEGNYGRSSVESTIFTYDHQYFLYSLTNNYDSSSKKYYSERGYEIDAYLLMGIAYGESNASKPKDNGYFNPFGEASSLTEASAEKARNRAVQALQDCGLAKDATAAKSMMDSDPFYEKAARVLSYMDNGIAYNVPLNVNYGCLDSAMPNINRWRNAVASGSTNKDDYGYRYGWGLDS